MSIEQAVWKGRSGRRYEYFVHPLSTSWKKAPGNYVFAKKVRGFWVAVYVGETTDLEERLSRHERRACTLANGATHIHAHLNSSGEAARKEEELDLILEHSPVCNREHQAA